MSATLVFNGLSLILTGAIAYFAYHALGTWKKQVTKDHVITVSRQLVRTTIALHEAIKEYRHMDFDEEYWESEYKGFPSHVASELDTENTRRWEPVKHAFVNYESALSEARVLFTEDQLAEAYKLLDFRNTIAQHWYQLRDHFRPETRHSEVNLTHVLSVLYGSNQQDQFTQELSQTVEAVLDRLFREHLEDSNWL